MQTEEPFLSDKAEIVKSMQEMRASYEKWVECLNLYEENKSKETKTDFSSITLRMRNEIRSLEWDIEDLEETYSMYSSCPNQNKLSEEELSSRQQFIQDTQSEIQQVKQKVFDSKYDVESNEDGSLFGHLFSRQFYSIAFDENSKSNNRYKRLDESEHNNNKNDVRIDVADPKANIPSNDIRFAQEIVQMMQEECGDADTPDAFNYNYEYTNNDFDQVYQPTLNVITSGKNDSALKRMVRSIPASMPILQRNRLASALTAFTLLIFCGFWFLP